MRDFTTVLRIAMLGLACVSMASCVTPTPPRPRAPAPPQTPVTVICPMHSPYAGPLLPNKKYDVNVTTWLESSGPKVKPESVDVAANHPGLCIDNDGNLHIYKSDVLNVIIHFHLDPGLGHWYPQASSAFQTNDPNGITQPPDLTNGVLSVYLEAKGPLYKKFLYLAYYVDYSNQTQHTEPAIQNH
jgi:hypothetical protein